MKTLMRVITLVMGITLISVGVHTENMILLFVGGMWVGVYMVSAEKGT